MLGMYLEKSARSLPICRQSSRVGESISAWGFLTSGSIRCSKGSPKAAVFPVPVCARATTSPSPLSRWGITFSCTGIGCSNPNSSTARRRSGLTPNSSNVVMYIRLSRRKVTTKTPYFAVCCCYLSYFIFGKPVRSPFLFNKIDTDSFDAPHKKPLKWQYFTDYGVL